MVDLNITPCVIIKVIADYDYNVTDYDYIASVNDDYDWLMSWDHHHVDLIDKS